MYNMTRIICVGNKTRTENFHQVYSFCELMEVDNDLAR